tara:strand:- start:323 stop:760 length:438 start_codon:yes stop_codon:yes gene_type:complete
MIKPLNFMPYVKSECMSFMEAEYGWKPYPQKHFESRFTRFFEGYWLPNRFQFDMRRVDLSSLILTNQVTRSEAIEELKKPSYDLEMIEEDYKYIAKKLGITPDKLRSYETMPKKYYYDYRNSKRMLGFGEWALSKIDKARRGGAF